MTGPVTVGVAIAVPQPHASVLTRWRAKIGDPLADLVFPHVTLLPPTPVPADRMEEVETHLDRAAHAVEAFAMHLSGTGTFRPLSPVVFIQIARGVADCEVLEREVRSGVLARELDFPYHPHVTVAQEVDDAALDEAYDGLSDFVARFTVGSFVLFSRAHGGAWEWRREFPLVGVGSPASR